MTDTQKLVQTVRGSWAFAMYLLKRELITDKQFKQAMDAIHSQANKAESVRLARWGAGV